MKTFSCGDVVPGCDAHFAGATDDDILAAVAQHAIADHGLTAVGADLASAVRAAIAPALV
jgi:predicted small metal-binding protein